MKNKLSQKKIKLINHSKSKYLTDESEVKISPIQKLKRSIRKIKLANRFLESTYGSVKIKTEMDLYKDKYLGVLDILFKTAKECYKFKFRTGFLLTLIEVLRLSMKIPDVIVITKTFHLLSLVCHYFKDLKNAIYSIKRMIGFTEEQGEFLLSIKGYELLASVYEDK